MQSCKVMRQMLGQPRRAGRRHGEAVPDTASDETGRTLHEHPGTGSAKLMAGTGGLLEAALTRQNLGCAKTVMTSNSRTARCGSACRVVWQGCSRLWLHPMPIAFCLLMSLFRGWNVRECANSHVFPDQNGIQECFFVLRTHFFP